MGMEIPINRSSLEGLKKKIYKILQIGRLLNSGRDISFSRFVDSVALLLYSVVLYFHVILSRLCCIHYALGQFLSRFSWKSELK